MSFSLPLVFLWAQGASAPESGPGGVPLWVANALPWFWVWGEPMITEGAWYGALITFTKVVGLFCLIAWVLTWVVKANSERIIVKAKTDFLDYVAAFSLLGVFASVLVGVLQSTERLGQFDISGFPLPAIMGAIFTTLLLIWVERGLWTTVARYGDKGDRLLLGGMHLALAFGFAIALVFRFLVPEIVGSWRTAVVSGFRWGVTYMGLLALCRVSWAVLFEVLALRPKRLYAVGSLAVVESHRRMWAPVTVLVIFAVILAFTHWFLRPPDQRPAEMGRLYIGTLNTLVSLLVIAMVTILTPISLPQDIKGQTIYTIVSKPVRRLELIWGRLFGYMALVTVLILVFGGISLGYLQSQVKGTIDETETLAQELREKDPDRSKLLMEQAEQLRTRMSARVPVKGVLTFVDSRGKPQFQGIDVGQDSETSNFETRSFVEGATPSTAIWNFGIVQDPLDPKVNLDRRVPVEKLLVPGTIEAIENQAIILEYIALQMKRNAEQAGGAEAAKLASQGTDRDAEIAKLRAESKALQDRAAKFEADADAAEKANNLDEADRLRREAAALHSPPVQVEMNFTVYRTTKGKIGEPVYAQLEVTNPQTNQPPFRDIFPIREYYTNKKFIPSSYLVGSLGALKCEVRCISPTQYLGMAESDFYILLDKGNFGVNFMIGLFGIWLQAMVLTAVGVFAGTFLSWPVAFLTTLCFFLAGQVAFVFLQEFALKSLLGGGPAESFIRLVTHDNQMSELTPTLGVIVAKTFDGLVMPLMGRLVYLVPNFAALDVTNTVAEGFAVKPETVFYHTLLAIGYALPFSIAGYFILKNREVAA
ncbi:MAG: hypothetical protein SFX72_10120 [Isosphaeraceae bacterium]|nr:hypothetical protein [Isosphaeraceae bacterium]